MGILDMLFGSSVDQSKVKEMLDNGAVIIDVRTPGEFQGGHVSGSKNIPLNEIAQKAKKIQSLKKPVVLCCASGNRSGQATEYLQKAGVDCINGGGWKQVNSLV